MVKNINIMNYKFYLIIIAILIASCIDDSEHGPYGADNIPPGQVTVDEVVNTAGGAIIYFTPPSDADLLYVKAAFEDENEIEREVIVSAVIDSLSIVGFAEEGTYPVEVFAVDRGENQSVPTIVNISPMEAPIHAILNSMVGNDDFGGGWGGGMRGNMGCDMGGSSGEGMMGGMGSGMDGPMGGMGGMGNQMGGPMSGAMGGGISNRIGGNMGNENRNNPWSMPSSSMGIGGNMGGMNSVSYTHLTLPTSDLV